MTLKKNFCNNAHLLGMAEGRLQLETPCLLVDLDVLENNIATAARYAKQSGKELWPHLKAHKCVGIAKLQKSWGAEGFCVASIGEAEVFAEAGFDRLLITSTFCTNKQIERINALLNTGVNLSVVIDSLEIIEPLNRLCTNQNKLNILIDIDMGRQRSGCSSVEHATELARQLLDAKNLNLEGIQTYAGQLSHMQNLTKRREAAREAESRADQFKKAIREAANLTEIRCTGGSTGTFMLDINSQPLTELQWGTYLFMDEEYSAIEYDAAGSGNPFEPSLFVASRVISANGDSFVTMDAGNKRFANQYGVSPRPTRGAPDNATFKPTSDEHGCLMCQPILPLGSLVELSVPHSDPTINLFDYIHAVRGSTLTNIWRIDARGVY